MAMRWLLRPKNLTRYMLRVALTACVNLPCGATVRYVDPSGESPQPAYRSIVFALSNSWAGDTIIVVPGTYREIRPLLIAKNVVLRSQDPSDPVTVAATVIDGQAIGPAVTFGGNEGETCTLEGFTITNGRATDGAGINGNGTLATIRNNVITGNVALGVAEFESASIVAYTGGGGIYWCNGLIENNIISDNQSGGVESGSLTTVGSGGGLFRCHGTIRGNTIVRNKAIGQAWFCVQPYACLPIFGVGGGLCFCNGTVQSNYIADNLCEYIDPDGFRELGVGGIAECDGTVSGNVVAYNSGQAATNCDGFVVNNLIYRNSRGALYDCDGILLNNVVWGNASGWRVGGLNSCDGIILNCIIWGNTGAYPGQLDDSSGPRYSCIQDWTGGGEGNINEQPRFMDADNGDFRVRADSPCIDAGSNSPDLPEFDIAGMHRIMFGGKSLTVDMGAYEFYINTLTSGPGPQATTFTWSSLADKTYSIFYTDDLLNWQIAIANFPSSGSQTTSWTDDGSLTDIAPLLAPKRFYRVLENP